ncbi:MAG: hypothetical protein EP336_09525 [Rhodobacteraceae bacterium]|nr:MAG: hypothetical protein EP336_09525 [Paracoccaceae bacterium]
MSIGVSLGAFAEGFASSLQAKKDRAEREAGAARQDRWLDILEKNPEILSAGGSLGSTPSTSGRAKASGIPTTADAAYIREGLIKRGMPDYIADGFLMNFHDESALNTSAVGDNGNAFGLAQWNGDRRHGLNAYASQKGVDAGDADVQLDYLMSELRGAESGAWKKIQATRTPGQAAAAIVNYFERPAEQHRARREASYLAYDQRPVLGAIAPAY